MIYMAKGVESSRVIDSIVAGLAADPFLKWLFPEPQTYLANCTTFVQLFGGAAFENGSAHHLQDYAGAALWLPPNVYPDEDILTKAIQEIFAGPQLEEIFSIFEQMDSFRPDEPYWYLSIIAVDPAQQNKGRGSALMKHALETVDLDKKLAYLESTNEANLTFYQRHGFELIGEIQAGSSPPLYPMIRESR